MMKKNEKSKVLNLQYKSLNIQNYFTTNKIETNRKIIIFKARTRMLNVSYNFGQKIPCPFCKIAEDNQKHLIECMILKITCPEILNNKDIQYSDIFSESIDKLNEISKLFEIAIRKRTEILNM